MFFVKGMSRDFEHFVFRKKTSDAIRTVNDIQDLIVFFMAIPASIINVNNDSIVIVLWFAFVMIPSIVIVIVVIHVQATYKVAHTVAG